MYQIDNNTASTILPTSTALGAPGYFSDGNPAAGQAATILPAEFMNTLMLENLNVLQAGGITPVKSQYNQLALAIAAIVKTGVNAQVNLYDGTPGRSLSPGSFGWGSSYTAGPNLVTDMGGYQVNYSGLYRYSNATAGKPPFGSGYGSILHSSLANDASGNYATQLVIDYAADSIGFRRLTGAAWSAFREIFHTGNLVTSTETTQGIQKVATQALTNAGVDDTTSISPKKLAAWFSATFSQATEILSGLLRLSTDAQVAAGTDNTTAITPLKLTNKTQSYLYDMTVGKLLSTGAFGLGSTYTNPSVLLTDSTGSQVSATGTYRYSSSTIGRPTFGSGFGSLQHVSVSNDGTGNWATQFAVDYAANSFGFRRLSGATGWQPWIEAWHKGNLTQATTAVPGIVQLGAAADVLAGTSTTLVPSIAALVSGLLGAGGHSTTDYLLIPYIDRSTGLRKNKILQWTTTPGLLNSSAYVWTFPAAFTTGVQFMGGMMIGSNSGVVQASSAPTLTNVALSNGTSGAAGNAAFVFVLGE